MNFQSLSHKPIREFVFKVPLSIKTAFATVESELLEKNISIKLQYYISDEWFVADGQTSIALPFYLCNQRIKKLEKLYLGGIEESSNDYIKKIIRHEVAHVLDNAYGLRRLKKRQKLFGLSSTAYPKWYYPKKNNSNYVENLEDQYGQSHPEEDWAETFAAWLNPKSNWKEVYKSVAKDKLTYLDSVMLSLPSKKIKYLNHELDNYKLDERSLRQYFQEKSRSYKIHYKRHCLRKFQDLPRVITLKEELRILEDLATNFSLKEDQITPLYNAIKSNFNIKYSGKSLSKYKLMKFTDILISKGTKQMFSEFHKVIV